ncbi:MAG: glucan biosynthesis protein [Gammaproteobacteria bacterium]
MNPTRRPTRALILFVCFFMIPPAAFAQAPAPAFGYANVLEQARALAGQPYAEDRPALPEPLNALDYDQYRGIRFRRERALFRADGLPFQVEMFPRGFLFADRVRLNVVESGRPQPVEFDPWLFNYGNLAVPPTMPTDTGFAGFRLLYPLNEDSRFDEVAVFLGASYFRAIGQKQGYGLSARGLAIDTGLQTREEFPIFREFWIEKPARDASSLTVYALMDSQRATGAFRFVIRPGMHTVIDVSAHLFMRAKVDKIGIAPLTSMFFHGETTDRFMDDFRPKVHDSDGLIIESGSGERIWRPLVNPRSLRISRYQVTDPRSFGLLQRDRNFDRYQDLEASYENRPSALIEPQGAWGKGSVELVEIPSGADRYDNIVAYWVPEQPVQPGQQMHFDYRLRFALDPEARLVGGRTVSTRIGGGGFDEPDPSRRKFVLDFAGEELRRLAPDVRIDAVCSASTGTISPPVAQRNPHTEGWRAFFELTPDGNQVSDLRCFLKHGEDVLSETWSFQWKRE